MIVFVVNHISAERAAIGNPSSYTDFHHNSRFEDLLNRIQWKSRDERYFDYYEAGMDLNLANRKKDSFVIYQKRLIEIYREMALSDGFETVDAMKPIQLQQLELRQSISQILRNRSRRKGCRS
jgi:dTMP kinase